MSGPLFKPFRALGYITEDAPFAVQRRGKQTYVTVSVGKTWQIYDTAKLTLVMVGPQLPRAVTALAAKGDLTFAAAGGVIEECKRMHRSGTYAAGHSGGVVSLMVLGDYLLSLGKEGTLKFWKIGQYSQPQVVCDCGPGFTPSCMVHPDTYLNKVVLGSSSSGQLQLWNFMTGKKVHTFAGWGSGVRALASSPALDVLGVGLADGRALLYNIKYDELLMEFHNVAGAGSGAEQLLPGRGGGAGATGGGGGACTAISFKTGPGIPLMAAGGAAGAITLWDLEQRRLHAIIRSAHDAPLLSLHFFVGEPLLMSSARDNSVKQWLMEGQEAVPRMLKFRSGHSAPPTVVAHYAEGLRLLSAGGDRAFRCFSTIQDQQSRELSQHNISSRAKRLKVTESELRLPPIRQMAACEVRERDWANVITCHEGAPAAYTWRLQHFTLGDAVLRPPPDPHTSSSSGGSNQQQQEEAPVTSVALSPCGNFGLVGTAAGRVDRFNMQSGLHRGTYWRQRQAAAEGPTHLPAHEGAVVGMAVDSTNKRMVTAGATDGHLRLWDFKKQQQLEEVHLGCAVTHLVLHPGSALAAVAGSDLVVVMVDIEAGRVVRRFVGHRDRLTSIHISSDCRWLISSSMDSTVRVWDIPSGLCLQTMHMGSPVTCLSLSSSRDLLATTHVNKRGVFLWSNQMMFGDPSQVASYQEGVVWVGLPMITPDAAEERGVVRLVADGGLVAGDDSDEEWEAANGAAAGGSSSSSDDGSSDEDEPSSSPGTDDMEGVVGEGGAAGSKRAEAAAAAAAAAGKGGTPFYAANEASGAPKPLAADLATLSALPRPQWETLLHLDTIKSRSKPLQPPKKPEAAPFFLPTVPTLAHKPVFDLSAAAEGVAAAAADGGGDDEAGGGGSSRVLKTKPSSPSSAAVTPFIRLLRAGGDSKDFTSFVGHIRGLTPAALDLELRSMALLEGASEVEVRDVLLLMEVLDGEVQQDRNWEFCQALIQHVLRIHADAVITYPQLAGMAKRLHKHLKTSWRRLDDLLQEVRCMTDFLSLTQQV